jgi:hypothetical protein
VSEPTQYISYLDETKSDNTNPRRYTIASMTAKKDDYLNEIEPVWAQFRTKYGIPNGQVLHFSHIKQLLNPDTRSYKTEWVTIFKAATPSPTLIDYPKLHAFFIELLQLLNPFPFIIQATGLRWNPLHNIRLHNPYLTDRTFFPAYITFREHLNLMGVYLLNLHAASYNKNNRGITKLRYDGDIGLGERDDLKEAYHHTISLGSRHFRSELTRQLFDEIRFIGKDEVGHSPGVTHAGSEIIDFITSNVTRHIWEIDLHKTIIRVPGFAPIDPMPIIRPKLINHQAIDDTFF